MRFTIDINVNINPTQQSEVLEIVKKLFTQNQTIMATIADLTAKVAELEATVNTEQQEIADALAALQAEVTRLTDIIAAGGTPEALQAEVDKIQAIIDDVKSTIPGLPEVPPA